MSLLKLHLTVIASPLRSDTAFEAGGISGHPMAIGTNHAAVFILTIRQKHELEFRRSENKKNKTNLNEEPSDTMTRADARKMEIDA